MPIAGIETISIPVTDHERARRFYRDVLGFVELPAQGAGADRWTRLRPRAGGACILLVDYVPGPEPDGVRDLWLEVDGIEEVVASLRARGVSFHGEPATTPEGRFARLEDPEGNGWVLHERPH